MTYPLEQQREYARRHYEANKEKYAATVARHRNKIRLKRRQMINDAKNKPCADCGVPFPPWIMQFDHVRDTKSFTIAQKAQSVSHASLLAEISKCDVVCANCHSHRTYVRRFMDE